MEQPNSEEGKTKKDIDDALESIENVLALSENAASSKTDSEIIKVGV